MYGKDGFFFTSFLPFSQSLEYYIITISQHPRVTDSRISSSVCIHCSHNHINNNYVCNNIVDYFGVRASVITGMFYTHLRCDKQSFNKLKMYTQDQGRCISLFLLLSLASETETDTDSKYN